MIKLELKLNLKQKLINHIQTRNYSQTYGVVSYDMPKDATWTPGQDLSDVTYDGHINENTLEDGLGRLVDGTYGGDNFKMDVGVGKGNGWVGWKNESFPKKYIELVFEFDTLRNFSLVNIFTNNCFSKEVQLTNRYQSFAHPAVDGWLENRKSVAEAAAGHQSWTADHSRQNVHQLGTVDGIRQYDVQVSDIFENLMNGVMDVQHVVSDRRMFHGDFEEFIDEKAFGHWHDFTLMKQCHLNREYNFFFFF
ncbi:unnamed protein product [Nesidiocoris tenuis]|uniref:Discoidin domain-containing protein n=1 Tax=Nesidiocoris tenuis TaxID=355587 RepID=A0A6H5H7R2_9HEMI|nr:unnamed protein product [Nesidiocoris tenuis]